MLKGSLFEKTFFGDEKRCTRPVPAILGYPHHFILNLNRVCNTTISDTDAKGSSVHQGGLGDSGQTKTLSYDGN